ncbi:magnesium transporter CorA family protein [Candidatus Saccharibacteria bacterium]|nr:magnesium transporter CorA family protein [Candidatus Saccharibacteria bacterium]
MITMYYSRARERALQQIDSARPGAWIVASEPTTEELTTLAQNFGLDRDILDDAIDIYEAPRVDSDNGVVYIFTRYCFPEGKEIATEPLLLAYTPDYLFTIARKDTKILDNLTHDRVDFITTQKTKTVLQILVGINSSYEHELTRVSRRILQLRAKMRQGQLTTREFLGIIELEEDLNEFLSALQPQALLFNSLLSGKYLRLYEEDRDMIEDIERSTDELITQTQGRLRTLVNMRQAYDAIATTNLNNTFKRLTSIAIFLTIPTILGGLWGMNVAVPFAHNTHAFLIVLAIIIVLMSVVIAFFHKKKWL